MLLEWESLLHTAAPLPDGDGNDPFVRKKLSQSKGLAKRNFHNKKGKSASFFWWIRRSLRSMNTCSFILNCWFLVAWRIRIFTAVPLLDRCGTLCELMDLHWSARKIGKQFAKLCARGVLHCSPLAQIWQTSLPSLFAKKWGDSLATLPLMFMVLN